MSPDDISARLAGLSPAQRALLTSMLDRKSTASAPAEPPSMTPVEQRLADIWRDVLRVGHVGPRDSFFTLGGDSITSLQISARAAAAGLRITSRQVLEEETVTALAKVAVVREADAAQGDDPVGEVALTPIQRWFFEQNLPESHHWDQAVFVEVRDEVAEDLVHDALRALVAHHDALRSTFVVDGARSRHLVPGSGADPAFRVLDLRGADRSTQDDEIRAAVTAAQQAIDLVAGPMLSAVLFRLGPDRADRLMIAIHHLVVDGVSFRVLMEDLENAYRALRAGAEIRLPAKTDSFRRWGAAVGRYAEELERGGRLAHWLAVPRADAVAATWGPAPAEAGGMNTVGRSQTVTVELPAEQVAALTRDAVRGRDVQPRDVLLGGFLLAWRSVTGRSAVQIDLEGHGREHLDGSLDVSRTVGWFTSIFPAVLELSERDGAATVAERVHRYLETVPDNGIGYGILRYLGGEAARALAALPQSEISFNYLGRFTRPGGDDSVFGSPLQVPSPLQSAAAPRRHLLEVVVTGVEDRLLIEITSARDFHRREDVEALAASYLSALEDVITHHTTARVEEDGARDFDLMRVSTRQLSAIARQVGLTR
ncbi:condensation domain-containing protein [Lentzea sp. NPDC059081]|uniref:condensation domain-containing protein n=1 Tax=Lentzea sp. NPDC059081 TaxID=3346719 RepID=UPI0036C82376